MGTGHQARDDSVAEIGASNLRMLRLDVREIYKEFPTVTETTPASTAKPRPASLPDRLSVNPKSPHYNQDVLDHEVGIRFNGVEKTNVEEYCVSEGWVRLSAGNAKDRFGNAMTVKLKGKVEPYFKG